MKKYDHLQIHRDHLAWESDIKMWSHDIKMWQQESDALEDALDFIHKAVSSHEDALTSHYNALVDHHNRLNQHEVDIKYVREGTLLDSGMLDLHKDEAAEHELQRKAHERLKRYHHTVMALTKSLQTALKSIEDE